MQLPGAGVWGPPKDRDTALAVLRRAVELGINHIDTAQFYGDGVSNELIRSALHPYPEGLVSVSKVGAARDAQGGWVPAQRPEKLRVDVEANSELWRFWSLITSGHAFGPTEVRLSTAVARQMNAPATNTCGYETGRDFRGLVPHNNINRELAEHRAVAAADQSMADAAAWLNARGWRARP